MAKNIKLEQPANTKDIVLWHKQPGFNIWKYRMYGIEFLITNQHQDSPGDWFIQAPGTGWQPLEFSVPVDKPKFGKVVAIEALSWVKRHFTICASRVRYDLEISLKQ